MEPAVTPSIPIPHYYLYGRLDDDRGEIEVDFLHIEPIRKRSGRYNWTITPHSHPHHYQLLHVAAGGGEIDIESRRIAVEPPCLISVPVGAIHQIRFHPDTEGSVITAAEAFVAQASLGDPRLIEITRLGGSFPLAGTGLEPEQIERSFADLSREFVYAAPGRRPAVMAHFITVLVALMRAQAATILPNPVTGRSYALALRYRDLVERHFREERRIEFYAGHLGVTPARLNAVCRARIGTTASGLLHDRIVTEAKRWLVYTGMTVAEVGYALGFDDPAYFSRFFSRRTGMPPGRLREHVGAQPPVRSKSSPEQTAPPTGSSDK